VTATAMGVAHYGDRVRVYGAQKRRGLAACSYRTIWPARASMPCRQEAVIFVAADGNRTRRRCPISAPMPWA